MITSADWRLAEKESPQKARLNAFRDKTARHASACTCQGAFVLNVIFFGATFSSVQSGSQL